MNSTIIPDILRKRSEKEILSVLVEIGITETEKDLLNLKQGKFLKDRRRFEASDEMSHTHTPYNYVSSLWSAPSKNCNENNRPSDDGRPGTLSFPGDWQCASPSRSVDRFATD